MKFRPKYMDTTDLIFLSVIVLVILFIPYAIYQSIKEEEKSCQETGMKKKCIAWIYTNNVMQCTQYEKVSCD